MSERRLTWQPGFSLLRKPARRRVPRKNRRQRFEFVVEHPQRACREPSFREHPTTVDTPRASLRSAPVQEHEPLTDLFLGTLHDELSIWDERSFGFETTGRAIEPLSNLCNSYDQSTSSHSPDSTPGECDIMDSGPVSAVATALTNIESPLFTSLPPTVQYSSLTQRFKPLLNRCMHFAHTLILPNQGNPD
jgi:hypothetical protein